MVEVMTKVILCILDGWAPHDVLYNDKYNAFAFAHTPVLDTLLKNNLVAMLHASGSWVGLPDGQMGNSEVGHMTIGAGTIVQQDLVRINNAIANDDIKDNVEINKLARHHDQHQLQSNARTCHVIGLLSDGGVHSHIDHFIYIIKMLQQLGVNNIALHIISDGRDVSPRSVLRYIDSLEMNFGIDMPCIASISGRYYTMDRDNRWERTELSYSAIVNGDAMARYDDAKQYIQQRYALCEYDEFIKPAVHKNYAGVRKDDTCLMLNFRTDRMKQILKTLSCSQKFAFIVTLTDCGNDSLHRNTPIYTMFLPYYIDGTLGQVISQCGIRQLRIAETEKYAHVTYFFNCGREEPYDGESRILIPSSNVATYDLAPEMSANEITDVLLRELNSQQYNFICVNYANADMVGHTGNMDAAICACETLDRCIERIINYISSAEDEIVFIITSDHGNVERMLAENDDMDKQQYTSHTDNLVPFIITQNKKSIEINTKSIGKEMHSLADIADVIKKILNTKMYNHNTMKL